MNENTPSAELLPCPFCDESTCISVTVEYGQPKWFAFCPPCNACGPWADSKQEARAAWNRRPSPAQPAQEHAQKVANLLDALDFKQAKIDALMMEFCPGEMSKEQRDEWARNQRRVTPEEVAAIHRAYLSSVTILDDQKPISEPDVGRE